MKKLVLMLGLACLFMVGCGGNTENKEVQPNTDSIAAQQQAQPAEVKQEECPMHALKDAFANWETLDETAKAELITKATTVFAEMDAKMEEMKAAGEEVCKEMAEMTEEQKKECEAKCAEMKAKWDNFENLDLEGKKDLIMERLNGCNHDGDKPCCNHDGQQPAAE